MNKMRTIKIYSLCAVIMLLVSSFSALFPLNPLLQSTKGEEILSPVSEIDGSNPGDNLGWNVSWVGDVNGDGYDDIVAGAPYADGYVFDWWNLSWKYRMKLTFDNMDQNEDLVNFPVLLNLSSLNFDFQKAKLDGTDLRFLDADDRTELNYHIEEWDASENSYVWVNVTEIEGGSVSDHIWMYYGNPTASYAQDIEGTYDGNFAGVWHLNETLGPHYDATKNNNDGSPQNGLIQNTQGKIDGADNFDGVDDYVNFKTSNSLNITSAITIEAWVKPLNIDNPGDDLNIVNKFETNARSYILSLDDDPGIADDWDFKLSSSGNGTDGSIHVSNIVDKNEWHYMAGTWDGSTMVLYENGVEIGTNTTFNGPIYQSATEVWIGDGTFYDSFEGIIDEVRISNSARSRDWIVAQYLLMDNRFVTFGNEEVRDWWNFDWGYRRKLTFDNSGQSEDLINFPILLNLSKSNFDYSKTEPDGTDLRFIDKNGITELKYHIEDWNASGYSYVWVKVTKINGGSSSDHIWMYYGNSGALDVQDVNGTYDENYFMVQHLNETSSTHYDSTSNNFDGNPFAGVIQDAKGKMDGADRFDGIDDYVNIGGLGTALNNEMNITITLWVKPDSDIGNWRNPLSFGNGNFRFELGDPTTDLHIFNSGIDTDEVVEALGSITLDEWNYLSFSSNDSAWALYVNGVKEDYGTTEGGLNASSDLFLGLRFPTSDEWKGTIDEVRISNITRSENWIIAQFLSMKNSFITIGTETASVPISGVLNDSGTTYLFFGYPGISISNINVSSANVTIHGSNSNALFGWSTGGAGDVNQDGYDDVIIGAPGWGDGKGRAYVFHGRDSWDGSYSSKDADLIMTGENEGDRFGFAVSGIFDPNGNQYYKNWLFRKKIIINSSQVMGDLNDFPVMINITDPDLRNKARVDGFDILFTSEGGGIHLEHEIESYNASLGNLVAWIRVPFVSSTNDTTIYMYYGNSGQDTPIENPQGVWDSNYEAVWHLNDDLLDSTDKDHDGTNFGSNDTNGLIGRGQDFERDDNTSRIEVGNWNVQGQEITIQAWVNFESFDLNDGRIVSKAADHGEQDHAWMISTRWVTGNITLRFRLKNGTNDSKGTTSLQTPNGALYEGIWYHSVATYDGNKMRLRLNKNEVDSIDKSGNIRENNWDIWLGNNPVSINQSFDGILDEVRISSVRRSDAWLDTEFNNINDTGSFYSFENEEINLANWYYRKPISINSSLVALDLVDFPVLVNITDVDLKNKARADGYDITFTSDDGRTRLDHEIEFYDNINGQLIAWVRIPTLSSVSETTIYMHYGNAGPVNMQNSQGVWRNNYTAVWHMSENGAGLPDEYMESTANDYHGQGGGGSGSSVPNMVSSKIGNGQLFDGNDDYINVSKLDPQSYGDFTISAWYKSSDTSVTDEGYILWHFVAHRIGPGFGFSTTEDGGYKDRLRLLICEDASPGTEYFGTSDVVDQQFHYVVAIRANNRVKIYVDGIEEIDVGDTAAGIVINADSNQGPYIGDFPGETEQMDGILDEIRLSSVGRSAEWISTTFNNQNNSDSFYGIGSEELIGINDNNSIIIGAYGYDNNRGRAYLFKGEYEQIKEITADSANVTITGDDLDDRLGWDVSCAGDVNNDGYQDVIIGTPGNNSNTGAAHILYGNASHPPYIDARDVDVILKGESKGDNFGFSVSDADDLNNDGYDDVIVGAPEYDKDPNMIWGSSDTKIKQNSDTANQNYSSVAIDTNGYITIVWHDSRNGESDRDIFAQKFDSLGNPLWGPSDIQVNQNLDSTDQLYPQVVTDSNGDAIVVWEDHRSGTQIRDIYAQKLDFNGNPLWGSSDVKVNQNSAFSSSEEPDIDIDSNDNVIVVWHENRTGPINWDLFAQKINSTGATQWGSSDKAVNQYTLNSQLEPAVAADSDDNAIVAWIDGRNGGTWKIYAQKLDSSGSAQWGSSDVKVALDSHTQVEFDPDVDVDSGGNAIIVWHDNRESPYDHIYAQKINATGVAQWGTTDRKVDQISTDDYRYFPAVIVDSDGNAIIVWDDDRNGLFNPDIYAQKIDASGFTMWGASDVKVNQYSLSSDQKRPDVAIDSNGTIYVVWEDHRAGDSDLDIYAQKINMEKTGAAYIYYGNETMDNTSDVILLGQNDGDSFGFSVGCAGDFDQDSYSDVFVGAPYHDSSPFSDEGAVYIFKGGQSMDSIADWAFRGIQPDEHSGWSVSSAENLDGNGGPFLIVGSPNNNERGLAAGKVYLLKHVMNVITISGITATPSTQFVNDFINISCSVSAPSGVNSVWVNITIPGGGYMNVSMAPDSGDQFYYYDNYSLPGFYQYVIWAEDSLGNITQSAQYQFEMLGGTPSLSLGQVNPLSGYYNTDFNFTVQYTHPDNEPPLSITVNITGPSHTGSWALIEVDSGDVDYTDGKMYYYRYKGFDMGSYSSHFSAMDTYGNWVESATLPFDILDGSPLVSQPLVNPTTGFEITGFNFTVTYTSPMDLAPDSITINITGSGVYDLVPIDTIDTDYTDGKGYYVNLSGFAVGSYPFHFAVNDTDGTWVESGSSSIIVLSGSPSLSSEQVNPTSGYVDSDFNFTVNYTSPMNLPPFSITVNITGLGIYDLVAEDLLDLNYTDGKSYFLIVSGFTVGNYSFHFAANDTMGDWTESGILFFDIINRPPTLSSPTVAPNSGNLSSGFNFSVIYTDLDDHAPDKITVNITGYGDYDLVAVDPFDNDHTDGKEYYYNATGFSLGSFTFKFAANDSLGLWAETGNLGFNVLNRPPSLSSPLVNPISGYLDSDFNFTVIYTDLDDHSPDTITVNITGYGDYDLVGLDPFDNDYTDGKAYYLNTSGFSLGSYSFHFAANDSQGSWVETSSWGFDVVNRPPTLSSSQVDPVIGYLGSSFNFTVVYTDSDNHSPSDISVNITGLGSFSLSESDPLDLDYSDGKTYHYNASSFSLGLHSFSFAARDSPGDWIESMSLQFEVINRVPTLSFGGVDPTVGYFNSHYNFSVTYLDPDDHSPLEILVNITGLGVFTLNETNSSDMDYTDGKTYYINFSGLPVGSYSYHFAATDSQGLWANETPEVSNPTVLPIDGFITVIDFTEEYSDDIQIIATLLDNNYQPISGESISIYIDLNDNGTYEPSELVGINQTDSFGTIEVTFSQDIIPGNWQYVAFYEGSINYSVTESEAEITIIPKQATLLAVSDDVEKGDITELTALLVDIDGNRIGDEIVAFYLDLKLNGIYEVTDLISSSETSSEGVSSILYVVDLIPEDYGFKAKYVGSGYYNVTEIEGLLSVHNSSNKPPMIRWPVEDQIKTEDSPPWTLDLTLQEVDLEDTGSNLNWYLTGVNTTLYSVTGMNSPDDLFTFIPEPDAFGNDETTLWLTDSSGNSVSQTLWINITPLNDAPYFNPLPPNIFVRYDDPEVADDDPSPWDYSFYVHDVETPISHLIITTSEHFVDYGYGYAEVDGLKVTFHYPKNMVGESIPVTITLSDGIESTNTIILVNVTSDWVPELVSKLPDITLYENSTVYNVFDLDDYFTDRDDNNLYFSSGFVHIDVNITENNTVDISSLGEWTGSEFVTFRAMDPGGALVEDTILVTVIPVNDGPKISEIPDLVVHYDYSYAFDLSPYISDPDNNTFEIQVTTSESTDYIWIPSYNNLEIIVNYPEDLNGMTIPVTIFVSDGIETSSQQININVTDDFPPEVIAKMPDVFFSEDAQIKNAFSLPQYFFDYDGDVLFYASGNTFINVTINSDLTVDFSAPLNWYGSEMVTFRASDPEGAIAEDTIMVVVVPVNDAPSLVSIPKQERKVGEQWILDISLFIDDVDNELSDLVITVESEVEGGYVKLVGNMLMFQYPDDVHEDIVTITVSDGELDSSRSFIVNIESPPQEEPTIWDMIPWFWVLSILLSLLLGLALIYRKRSRYKVYELFLIHEKGLPLAHAAQKKSSELEDVVVSGMFTAVQDFISDAFAGNMENGHWELDEMKFGENKILIERSENLFLAVIFEGNSDKLRLKVKKLLVDINLEFSAVLSDWDGDMTRLKGIRAMTMTLIPDKSKKRAEKKDKPPKPEAQPEPVITHEEEPPLQDEKTPKGQRATPDDIIEEARREITMSGPGGLARLTESLSNEEIGDLIGVNKSERKYECPVCGGLYGDSDPSCPRCGTEFERLKKLPEQIYGGGLKCAACGTDIKENAMSCSVCGSEFMEAEELEQCLECPRCGALVGDSDTSCPFCGVEFSQE
jgi:rubrerythrin